MKNILIFIIFYRVMRQMVKHKKGSGTESSMLALTEID